MTRPDSRAYDELRPVSFVPGVAPHASGSVLVSFGNTRVICAATIEDGVPTWMKVQGVPGGWLTAEYSMLPYSTHDRKTPRHQHRPARRAQPGDSTADRALAARRRRPRCPRPADLVDRLRCAAGRRRDADGVDHRVERGGGARVQKLIDAKKVARNPLRQHVAAVSAGIFEDAPVLDLCYAEDKDADSGFQCRDDRAG